MTRIFFDKPMTLKQFREHTSHLENVDENGNERIIAHSVNEDGLHGLKIIPINEYEVSTVSTE